jgi:hypothetical protein
MAERGLAARRHGAQTEAEVRILVRSGLLGDSAWGYEWAPSGPVTPLGLVLHLQRRLPRDIPIDVACNGRLLGDADYDQPLAPDADVLIAPTTAGGIVGFLIPIGALFLASVATNYLMQALTPRPRVPGEAAERGDVSSQTYAWDGIQTNYSPFRSSMAATRWAVR